MARENASVVARENASVVAWGNASVVAWGNASVEARENASVEARENASVVAWGNAAIWAHSSDVTVLLWAFAVCWALAQAKITKKSETATIITPTLPPDGVEGWLEAEGVEPNNGKAILFKRVSRAWKTQEDTTNETDWEPGKTLEHHAWNPGDDECGAGKFHACSRAYFCDQFREISGDRYVAVEIKLEDLYAWPAARQQYPHKIAFRRGLVLHECNKHGRKIERTPTDAL